VSFYETDTGAWGVLTPTSGPFGAGENLGFWFEIDTPGMLAGFRQYSDGRHPNFALFQFWDSTPKLLAEAARSVKDIYATPAGTGWRNTWLHPRIPLSASTPYLISACVTEFWADFGTLTSASVVGGHFTVYQDGTGPIPSNGVYDSATDTNGGFFSFISPPSTPTAGNWYGIDVLVKF